MRLHRGLSDSADVLAGSLAVALGVDAETGVEETKGDGTFDVDQEMRDLVETFPFESMPTWVASPNDLRAFAIACVLRLQDSSKLNVREAENFTRRINATAGPRVEPYIAPGGGFMF